MKFMSEDFKVAKIGGRDGLGGEQRCLICFSTGSKLIDGLKFGHISKVRRTVEVLRLAVLELESGAVLAGPARNRHVTL